jgi:thiamine biosynthesis lipoprotein
MDVRARASAEMSLICRHLSYVFGTLAEIVLAGFPHTIAQEIAAAVFEEFDRLHAKLHPWESSDLTALNEAIRKSETPLEMDAEMAHLIRDATHLSERSGGFFNPAVGKLVKLWNFHDRHCSAALPDFAAVASVVQAHPRMTDLALRENTIVCANSSVQLDFGGYAKGYALERGSRLLRDRGAADALLNLGGHIMALGRCGRRAWSVGIRHPRRSGLLARIDLHDGETISTSGDYERYYVHNGTRHAHIIDPRTGHPSRGSQAASVLTSGGPGMQTLSDAASGALFVAGPRLWRETAQCLGVAQALLVDGHGAVHLTREMRARLQFAENGHRLEVH